MVEGLNTLLIYGVILHFEFFSRVIVHLIYLFLYSVILHFLIYSFHSVILHSIDLCFKA